MRKHFTPNRPVMTSVGAYIQKMFHALSIQYITHVYVGIFAWVFFGSAKYNLHIPQIGVFVVG